MPSGAQPSNFDPSSNTENEVPGTKEQEDTGMDYKGEMPMPKRKKRNTGKRDDS